MREFRIERKWPATKWVNMWNRYEIGGIDQRKLVSILCELVFDAIIILNYCFSFLCWRMQNRWIPIFGRCVEFDRKNRTNFSLIFRRKVLFRLDVPHGAGSVYFLWQTGGSGIHIATTGSDGTVAILNRQGQLQDRIVLQAYVFQRRPTT